MHTISPVKNNIVPRVHLANAVGKENARFMIVGDSISTLEPSTTFDQSESLWGLLRAEITRQNPQFDPVFINYGIGATRFDHLDEVKFATLNSIIAPGLSLPAWTNQGGVDPATMSWMDAVVSAEPDVVFLNFGMNDSWIFVEANFRNVINAFKFRLPNTDLVVITNMVPNYYSTVASVGGLVEQNGRLFAAERLRTFAEANGHGLIDLGRDQCRMVAGFDPRATVSVRNNYVGLVSMPITLPMSDLDFQAVLAIPASVGLWSSRIKVTTSQQNPNAKSWLEIYRDAGGNIAVEFVIVDDGPGRYLTHVSDIAAPTSGSFDLSIKLEGGVCRIEADGHEVFHGQIQRHGGRFQPVISFLDGRVFQVSINSYRGIFKPVNPETKFAGMFGSTSISDAVEGGNDANHPSNMGWTAVVAPVIEGVDFSLKGSSVARGVLRSESETFIISDDAIVTIPTPYPDGTFTLWSGNTQGGVAVVGAQVHYHAGAAAMVMFSQSGAQTDVTGGAVLAVGDVTDGNMGVNVVTGGIQIINRRGVPIGSVRYLFQGGGA